MWGTHSIFSIISVSVFSLYYQCVASFLLLVVLLLGAVESRNLLEMEGSEGELGNEFVNS